ncbi:hypothetical protein QQ045_023142 [Rhodiola kirilowii]
MKTPGYKPYQEQVLNNCTRFAQSLMEKGYDIVSGGTENHLVLVNLKNKGIDGSRVEKVLEIVHIAANKNTVPGDVSGTKLKDFVASMNDFEFDMAKIRQDVEEYAKQFPTIGFEKETMKYKN